MMTVGEVRVRVPRASDQVIVAIDVPIPKYARLEIERRWLVPNTSLPPLAGAPRFHIDDRYIDGGHLRLRTVTEPDGTRTRKLGKKYPAVSIGHAPVVSIYVTDEEAEPFADLPGRVARKHRYKIHGGALDVYIHPWHPFAVFEIEFGDVAEASAYMPPDFVGEEVTGNPAYSGFALATP